MISSLKHRLPDLTGPFLNHVIFWAGTLLVVSAVAFAAYYYIDQRGSGADESPLGHQIASLEEAVRANPADANSRLTLAHLYFTDRRLSDAVQQYEAVLSTDDKNPVALIGLGRTLLETGDRDAALDRFQQVVDMAQKSEISGDLVEAAHFYLGSIYLDKKQPDEAVDNLKKAVAIDRTDADAWQVLGAALVEAGTVDEAIDALTKAILFVPNFTEAYESLVAAYEQKGLTAETQYARGMVAYSEGRYDEALDQVQAATKGSPTFAAAFVGLGLVQESRSERDQAIAAYNQALHLDPTNFTAQTGLARLGAPSATAEAETP